MRIQKYVWLNGSDRTQLETLDGSDNTNTIEVGFGYKPRSWMLRRRLYYIRHNVHR